MTAFSSFRKKTSKNLTALNLKYLLTSIPQGPLYKPLILSKYLKIFIIASDFLHAAGY